MTDYIKEARKAKREGDYSKAGDFFSLAGDTKSAMEMYLKGGHHALAARLEEKGGDPKTAAKYYVQAGKFLDAAEIYFKLKDYRTASVMFEKHGDNSRASEMAEKAGDLVRAAMLAEQADQLERAGALFVQAQRYEKAADVYYRILEQLVREKEEKGYVESHRARLAKFGSTAANLFFRLKNYAKAAWCFEQAPNEVRAAECYTLAEQPEKAAQLYFKIQKYEQAYDVLSGIGEDCTNKELYADICFHVSRFHEAGELYLLAGHTLRAAESFEEGKSFFRAAMLYEGLEDYAKAGEQYLKMNETQRAAELYEKSKNFEYAAKLYEEAGSLDKAIECLTDAGQILQAAELLIKRDETQKAISLLQNISREHDDYPEACRMLGNLFSRLEMYSVAIQKFEDAIHKQPLSRENIDTYYGMGVAYEKGGFYTKAREIYEKIVAVQLGYKDALSRIQAIKNMILNDTVSAADMTPTASRRVVASRYELVEKLGRDEFGTLYKGHDMSLARPVLLRRMEMMDENSTRNIMEQTKLVAALSHSNILAIYDSGKDDDRYFVCMEYVDGQTLRNYLSKGPLDISEICEIASQICLGLAYAHQRSIVHYFLSPENIYVSSGRQIKIANFGLEVRAERGHTLTMKQYTSPEQILAHKPDRRADFYALGIILYEMLYGTAPFTGQDVELQHVKKVLSFPENSQRWAPQFLLKIIQRCLQKDRQKRYSTAEEILVDLEVADIVPGMVLNERYEIIKELGTGGMGRVYQARDRDLDEVVALKVLRAEISVDPLIQKRFVREIKVARMITHPYVVKVFDIGKYKGNRYISMEYIQGTNLDEWLKNNQGIDMRLKLTVLAKIIQGLQAAHSQGIIHRDLKPQNVLLDRSMNPHVLDFGIARSKDHVDATASGQVMGSPKYMSPEQIQGKDLDKRADIYSLGVMMYYMFAGEEPFTGEDPRSIIMKHLTQPPQPMRSINPEVPPWLETIAMKTLEKDRNQRYSNLKEVLDDLKRGYETQRV